MHTNSPATRVFRFGVFDLDAESGELRRHGLKIRLPEQSLKILLALLSRPGEVVARDELRHVLWAADTFVDFEVGLNSAVRKLREALDDSADMPRFVETLPRRGYRFLGAVTVPLATPSPPFESVDEPAAGPAGDPVPGTPVRPVETAPGPGVEALPATAPPIVASQRAPASPRLSRGMAVRAAVLAIVTLLLTAGAAYQRGGPVDLRVGSAADPIRSLVVLPFENLTGDAGQESFVDSVTDAVTSHLAQVGGLNVTSRTSARRYKQTAKGLPEIGRELEVEGVVEGAVVRSGDGVRISAKLIRAATDRHVWAQSYPGDVGQMLALQRQIASDVAVAAGRPASPAVRAGARRVDPKAYDAYVKGLTARGFQRYDGFRRAVAYFEEAVAIQPDFAEAYAALARAQVQFLFTGPLSPSEAVPKAEAAARKALELDPTSAHAHIALAQVLNLYYWRWDEGTKSLQRAVDSEKQESFTAVSESLIRHGRFAEGLAAAERTRALDPLSVNAQNRGRNRISRGGTPRPCSRGIPTSAGDGPGDGRGAFPSRRHLHRHGSPLRRHPRAGDRHPLEGGPPDALRSHPGARIRVGWPWARRARDPERAGTPPCRAVRLVVRHCIDSRCARRESIGARGAAPRPDRTRCRIWADDALSPVQSNCLRPGLPRRNATVGAP